MNKFAASVGLIALGVSAVQADTIPGMDAATKPWSVSATLRGFYDDNVGTTSGPKRDSFGIEVSPTIGVNWSPDPTTHLVFGYLYSAKYYDRKPPGNSDNWDQTHTLNLALDHAFSERYQVKVHDSFVIGQEPDTLRAGNASAIFQRIPGDNIRNYGGIDFDAQLTRELGLEIGYANAFYDYTASGAFRDDSGILIASPSGVLDRIENSVHLDARWTIQPETIGIIGAQYRTVNYTADEPIGDSALNPSGVILSDNRNFHEYYAYVGADHTFRPDLTGSARLGARYTDFYNDPQGNGSGWGPYAALNFRWTYLPESYVELGLTEDVSATDLVGSSADTRGFTSSAESTVVYGSMNHRFTPKLRGSAIGQFQNNSYSGGSFDSQSDQDFLIGLNLTYQFTPHFSSELGYNYDRLESNIPGRKFDRNRVYIGVTASY
jgi:putative beta-barrel porin BBP2